MNSKIIKKVASFLMLLAIMSSTLATPAYNIGMVITNAEEAPATDTVSNETSSETTSAEVSEPVSADATAVDDIVSEEVIEPVNDETTSSETISAEAIEPASAEPTSATEPVSVAPVAATTQSSNSKVSTNLASAPVVEPLAPVCREDTNNSSAPYFKSISQVGNTEQIQMEYSGSGSSSNPTILPGYEITSISFFIPPEANGGNPSNVVIGPIMAEDFLTPLDFSTGPNNTKTTSFMLPDTNRAALRDHIKKNGSFNLKYEITMTSTTNPNDCVTHKTTDTKKLVFTPVLPAQYSASVNFALAGPTICSETGQGTLNLNWTYSSNLINIAGAQVEIYVDGVLKTTFTPSSADPKTLTNVVSNVSAGEEHFVSITVSAAGGAPVYTFASQTYTVPAFDSMVPEITSFDASLGTNNVINFAAAVDPNGLTPANITYSIGYAGPGGLTGTIPISDINNIAPFTPMAGTYNFTLTQTYNDGENSCGDSAADSVFVPPNATTLQVTAADQDFCTSETWVDIAWSYDDYYMDQNVLVDIKFDDTVVEGPFAPSSSDPGILTDYGPITPGDHVATITIYDATDPTNILSNVEYDLPITLANTPAITSFTTTYDATEMGINVIADVALNDYSNADVTATIKVTTPDRNVETYDFTIAELADLPPYPPFMSGTYKFDLTINYLGSDSETPCNQTETASADVPTMPPFIEVYPAEQDFCTPNNLVDIFWYYDPGYVDQDVLIEVSIDGESIEEPFIPDDQGFGELLNYGPLADGSHDATISILDGETLSVIDETTYTFTTPMINSPEITEFSATASDDMNVLLDYEIDLGNGMFEVPVFLFSAQLEVTGPNGYSDTIAVELDEFDYITTDQIDYKVPEAGTYDFTLTLDYEDEESSCAITSQSTSVNVKDNTLAYTGLEISRFEAFIITIQEMFK